MKKAIISIEAGEICPNTGLVKVWWWKEGAEFNQQWQADKPIWEFLTAKQVFYLCVVGDTVEINEKTITQNFQQIG